MISDDYRKQNEILHNTKPGYGTGGARWVTAVSTLCAEYDTDDVLDYGCGKGRLAAALPFHINQYDPAIPKHCTAPEPADIVVCTDVLEHIEPEYIDDVLDHLQQLARECALLNIATRHAHKTLPDGRNTHILVKPPEWWFSKLMDRWDSVEMVEAGHGEFTGLVSLPKKIVAVG